MINYWYKHVEYNLNIIKKTNPIPGLVKNLCMQLPTDLAIRNYYYDLIIILTELYNNSLDHGLLNISSDLKQDNLQEFYNIRKQQLDKIHSGYICFDFVYNICNKQLILEIKDSGQGFDYSKYNNSYDSNINNLQLSKPYGRGLFIINKLVDKLEYLEQGTRVRAVYTLRNQDYKTKSNNYSKKVPLSI